MADAVEELDLDSLPSQSGQAMELSPYVPERQRDWVRTIVTVGLLGALVGIIFWACRETVATAAQWSQTKEMLQIMLPAITGLLGSVIGFYFGSGTGLNNRSGTK